MKEYKLPEEVQTHIRTARKGGYYESEKAIEKLGEMKYDNPEVQRKVAEHITEILKNPSSDPTGKMSGDEFAPGHDINEPHVREAAAIALGRIGFKESVEHLLKVVRTEYKEYLKLVSAEAVKKILSREKLTATEREEIKPKIIEAMQKRAVTGENEEYVYKRLYEALEELIKKDASPKRRPYEDAAI